MPIRWWKHKCPNDGTVHGSGSPDNCSYCGATYEYDGWGHTSSEAKVWFQKRFGVKIIGPHRSYLHEVFSGSARPCSNCNGTGYHDIDNGKDYEVCATCEGSGRVWVISGERIRELRKIVLKKYPDAAAPWDISNPEGSILILQDLKTNEMLVVEKEEKE
ncbi:hypothetical protein ACFL0H_00225 [Thermodesulfobacteriota bacterium]